MDDLQRQDVDYWKPILTILYYFKFTAIDIFLEYKLVKLLKIHYLYILIHILTTYGVFCFLKEAVCNGGDLMDVAVDISYAFASVEGCLLYLHFLNSRKKIKTFVLKLGNEWCDDGSLSPDLIASRRKKIKSLDRFNYVYFTGVIIFLNVYLLIPLASTIVKKYIFGNKDVVYFLPFRLKVPFDYEENFLLYLIVYGYVYMLSINLTCLINGSLLLLSVLMGQLQVLFDLLQDEFKDIFKSKADFNMDDKIRRAVQKHSRLLKLIDELSAAFGSIFLLQLFFLSGVFCFFAVSAMIKGKLADFKNLMGSMISINTIYQCCYHGHLLSDSAVDVGRATYDSEWHSLSCVHKKIVLIIILRSQQITYIKSTSYTHISLTTFIKIMNMAWSFISVITGMYKENERL